MRTLCLLLFSPCASEMASALLAILPRIAAVSRYFGPFSAFLRQLFGVSQRVARTFAILKTNQQVFDNSKVGESAQTLMSRSACVLGSELKNLDFLMPSLSHSAIFANSASPRPMHPRRWKILAWPPLQIVAVKHAFFVCKFGCEIFFREVPVRFLSSKRGAFWEKLNRGVSKPGDFPLFSGKVQIVSRTLSGLFLLGALNRPRKRKGTNRENPRTIPEQIGKIPEKSGKSQKGQKRKDESRSGNPPV